MKAGEADLIKRFPDGEKTLLLCYIVVNDQLKTINDQLVQLKETVAECIKEGIAPEEEDESALKPRPPVVAAPGGMV